MCAERECSTPIFCPKACLFRPCEQWYGSMKRHVVLVQLMVTALFAAVGGFVAVSVGSDAADADPGGMTAAVPMMTEAQLRSGGASASSDLATTTITPVRILDTRPGAAAMAGTKTPWGPLETRTVQAAGLGSIPSDAVGVVVNVPVLNATAPDTFLTLYPTGAGMPNASTINPQPNQVAFNAATLLLGNGTFEIYNYSGTVDVIIDVVAYMTRDLADQVDSVTSKQATLRGGGNTLKVVDQNGDEFKVVQVSRDGTQWIDFVEDGDLEWIYATVALEIDGKYYQTWGSGWGAFEYLSYTYFESADCTGTKYARFRSREGADLGLSLQEYVELLADEGVPTYHSIFHGDLKIEPIFEIDAGSGTRSYTAATLNPSGSSQVMASRLNDDGVCTDGDFSEPISDYTYYPFFSTAMPNVAFPLELVDASQ